MHAYAQTNDDSRFSEKYENGEISKSFLKDIKDIQLIQKPTKEELTMLNDLRLWRDVDNNYSLKCLIFGKAAEMVIYNGEDEEDGDYKTIVSVEENLDEYKATHESLGRFAGAFSIWPDERMIASDRQLRS